MTDLKVASRSAFAVSFKASVMFRRLVAYFFLATTMCSGLFVTFDRPAYPTEDTALLIESLTSNVAKIGESSKSNFPPGKFDFRVTYCVKKKMMPSSRYSGDRERLGTVGGGATRAWEVGQVAAEQSELPVECA